jgi:outer membrane protein OmpU
MHFAEPDVGIGLNTGDQSDWISYAGVGGTAGTFRGAFGSTYVQAGRVNDTNRITYYTPRIEGVQFGISYVPNSGEDSNAPVDRHTALADGYAVGLNFKRDLGGFALGVSGGFGTIDDGDGADPTSTNIGITLAAGGFKGGVSFADSQDDPSVGDMNGMSVGISYATGPMTVGLSYWDSERDGGGTALAASINTVHLGLTYSIGPGIRAAATLGRTEVQDDSGTGSDNEGSYIVTGLQVSF